MVKSWLVQDQTVLGKDYSNLLIADSLLKTIWFINAPCYGNEALASPKANELTIPEQTATGKGKSNPFMAGGYSVSNQNAYVLIHLFEINVLKAQSTGGMEERSRSFKEGVKPSTSACGSQPSGNTKKDKNRQTPRTAYMQHSKLNANSELKCVKCNSCMLSDNHDLCVLDFINNVNARNKSKSVKRSSKRKVWKPTRKSQEKDTVIKKLIERIKSLSGKMNEDKIKKDLEEIETINIELDRRVSKLIAENEHLKQTYKQLYDSIKLARIRSKEQCDDLINQVNLKFVEISDLNASLQEKVLVITYLKDDLRKLKRKALVDNDVTKHPSDPEMLKIDVEPIIPKL
ncbi:hypothetical protein Tco_1275971 [Tanacetum coccineum]